MRVCHCKVNHLTNPIGFVIENPVFSWVLEDTAGIDPFHVLSQIVIRKDAETVYMSEPDYLDPRAATIDLVLEPRTRYEWSLIIEGQTFACGFFETGKQNEAWEADWITPENQLETAPWFVKAFKIQTEAKIASARLYMTGLGLYETYLNGEKVGDEYLTPGCTLYEDLTQVQTYDVTDQLRETNELRILVGDGWYKGRFGFRYDKEKAAALPLMTIAELHICYADGTTECIKTDTSWRAENSDIVRSGIYFGEEINAQQSIKAVPVKRVASPNVVLRDRYSLPIRFQEAFVPKIVETANGELVLDIGQNLAGSFELLVKEDAGTKIVIEVGETLQDQCFYRDNLRSAEACFLYTSDGTEKIVRPHFTFYGFRYLRLQGFTQFNEGDLIVHAMYSDFETIGELKTGHSDINKLIANTFWGMKSNFLDVPTDCPQRDERMGWTGDAQVFSKTAMYYADLYTFYTKYLKDMELEQARMDGKVPDTVPGFGNTGTSTVWGDATCIIPWNMYRMTGDKTILEKHYPYMKQWVDYIAKVDGTNHGWRDVFHYGDWLALDSMSNRVDEVKGGTDEGFIADVYYRKSLLLTAEAARLLGKDEEAVSLEQRAQLVLEELQKEFFSVNGRCCINTQTAAILTLKEGLNDPNRAKKQLLENLKWRNGKLATGFVGTPLLCEVLAEQGMLKEAYKLLLSKTYPGWLYSIQNGATTIWERWNSIDETGHISSTGMNSLNHYSYGSVVSFLWEYLLGFRPDLSEPGYRVVRIQPNPCVKLSCMEASYQSPSGTYQIGWSMLDRKAVTLRFTIPAGCKAIVVLNEKETMYEAGSYEVTYCLEQEIFERRTVEDVLQDIIEDPDAEIMLREELPDFEHYVTWGRNHPLLETMKNSGDATPERIKRINEKLSSNE